MAIRNKYFIADPHFFHDRPFIYSDRGYSSIEEHDEAVIANINSRVRDHDHLYILGDLCFDYTRLPEILGRLNGKIILLLGNHDKGLVNALGKIPTLTKHVESIVYGYLDTYLQGKTPITLCHFAMRSWEKSHYNAIHLYGHHHGHTDFGGKTLNVTVDNLKGFPISEEEVLSFMSDRPDNWDYLSPMQASKSTKMGEYYEEQAKH